MCSHEITSERGNIISLDILRFDFNQKKIKIIKKSNYKNNVLSIVCCIYKKDFFFKCPAFFNFLQSYFFKFFVGVLFDIQ